MTGAEDVQREEEGARMGRVALGGARAPREEQESFRDRGVQATIVHNREKSGLGKMAFRGFFDVFSNREELGFWISLKPGCRVGEQQC